jgi:peptide/nickel transport system substrate-binding protein
MRLRVAAFAIVTSLTVAACSGDKSAGSGGGTVIAGMGSDPSSLFPLLVLDETGDAATDLLFEKLAAIGPNLSVIGDAGFTPRLAKSWDWSKDSLAITFHLDPAARFHDGTPVTANDVRYTFRIARDTMLGSTTTPLITNIDSVTVQDSLTATFWYHRRTATQFFDAVYQLPPVPEHVYGKVPVAELRTSEVTRNPVGSGRFRFMRYEPNVRLELVADTANFLGRPKIDRVIFMLGQAPTSAAASVLAGQMDFYVAFPIDQAEQLDSSRTARPLAYSQTGYGFLAFNAHPPKSATRPHPLLGDLAVRRALSMSLDRAAMLTNVYKSTGRLTNGPFPAGVALSDSTLAAPPYDTVAAARLLDGAGWKRGADGVRMKDGKPLRLELIVPTSSTIRVRYAELIQEQANRAGFRIEVARMPFPQFAARQQAHDYDLSLMTVFTDPTVAGIQQYWSSSGIPSGSNPTMYSNRMVDATLDSANRAADGARMKAYVMRAFRQIVDDAPAVWLYSAGSMAAVNRRIDVAPLPPDGWWGNLADWSIPADKRIDRDRVGLRPAGTP